MKKILQYLFEYKTIEQSQARELLTGIGKGIYNETEITALMSVYLMRSITIDELKGFREALLEMCIKINLEGTLIDIVGTGGDGKNTFNISTLSCFIVAGAGYKVAKHGNYAASSVSGSSNVMEYLGYAFSCNPNTLQRQLDRADICFLHAPLFHTALKSVASVRKNLGMRTFFNLLGPLVNPASPDYQCIGVYNMETARIYNYLLQQLDRKYLLIHTLGGYDELSLTSDACIFTPKGNSIWTPEQLGGAKINPKDIYGGNSIKEAAKIFMQILKKEGTTAQNQVVIANAAMTLFATGQFSDYASAFQSAKESLESGRALQCFHKLLQK